METSKLRKVRLDLFAYEWEKEGNIQEKINAITAKGDKMTDADYQEVGRLEGLRNDKIDYLNKTGTNVYGATKTNNYTGYADKTDYSSGTMDAIRSYMNGDSGALQSVSDNLYGRINKQNSAYGMRERYGDPDLNTSENSDLAFLQGYGPDFNSAVQNWLAEQRTNSAVNNVYNTLNAQYQSQIESLYDALYSMPQYNVPDYSDLLAQLGNYQAPTYEDRWDDVKQKLANAALNMNYDDWLGSTQYEQLAKRYGMYGDQAMRDTLGQMASRTGGLASSYAQTAAQQSYNDYMAQLEQAAYDMYRNEQSEALEKANAAFGYSDNDFERYLDDLAQYNTDRGFAFDVISKAIDQSNYANEWAYRQQQAALERADALRNQEYQRAMDERNWQYQQAQDQMSWDYKNQQLQDARDKAERADAEEMAKVMAGYGDYSRYAALGYSDDEIARMAAYELANAPKASSSGRRSSGSSSSGAEDYERLFAAASKATSPQNYINSHHKEYGFDIKDGLWAAYQDWQKGQSDAGGDSDIRLYNQEGPEGVDIPGHGNYSWNDLLKLVNEGKVREVLETEGGKRYRKYEWK